MTLPEWMRKFGTDEACQDYLFSQRWPDGFVCARCQVQKSWKIQRSDRTAPLYECTACHYQASLTVGTIFHWINVVISNAKTFIDGTYHGRVRARRQLYLEEFMYRFNRRFFGTRIAD